MLNWKTIIVRNWRTWLMCCDLSIKKIQIRPFFVTFQKQITISHLVHIFSNFFSSLLQELSTNSHRVSRTWFFISFLDEKKSRLGRLIIGNAYCGICRLILLLTRQLAFSLECIDWKFFYFWAPGNGHNRCCIKSNTWSQQYLGIEKNVHLSSRTCFPFASHLSPGTLFSITNRLFSESSSHFSISYVVVCFQETLFSNLNELGLWTSICFTSIPVHILFKALIVSFFHGSVKWK